MRVSDVRSTSRICRSCFTARKAQTPGSSCGRSSNAEISAAELNGGADTENCRPMMVGRTHRKCQRVSEGSCAKFAHRCLVLSCFRYFFLLLVSTLKRSVVARTRGLISRARQPGGGRRVLCASSIRRLGLSPSGPATGDRAAASSQGHERRSTCTSRAQISFWNVPARGNSGLHEMSGTFRQN